VTDAAGASVPGYLLVQGKVTDLEGFKAYNAALPPIYKKFGGHYIAKFPSKEAAWGFWKSAEYEAAKKLRAGKGTFFVTVLDGLPGT
jgi:uncharacterized protein (DUF1330 family)